MKKQSAISLLLIIGISLIPWQLMCTTHPSGHDHEKHDGLSICELHKIVAQQDGEHLLPPMDCEHLDASTDDFQISSHEKITLEVKDLVFLAVLFHLNQNEIELNKVFDPPNPDYISETLITDCPLRAPPIFIS
ncbi:hypothetical protein [Marivirga sp.]|uniref:hypothetical protein n=1 Tax=Marivirga sp. TaxID=2018662 RepID=UPI003DA6FD4E